MIGEGFGNANINAIYIFIMTSEGIFFAPRDDTGIIAFVLVNVILNLKHHSLLNNRRPS